jgi:8-oxo-dGTP pyrophosphatase MutT (NUDIX family)
VTDAPGRQAPVPAWLDPIRTALGSITGSDLTTFLPPEDHDARSSAVLILFGEGERGPDLLLTERSHTMRSHPGQVSFPGGRLDPGEGPHEAALREAYEETGLDPAGVEIIGDLPQLWIPPSNNVVTPVVGWWHDPSPVSVKSLEEVHAIYRVPIAELRDPAHDRPGLPDRPREGRHPVGLHRRDHRPALRVRRLDRDGDGRAARRSARLHAAGEDQR